MLNFKILFFFKVLVLGVLVNSAHALEVNVTKETSHLTTVHNGKVVKIQRNQNQNNVLIGACTKTSPKCPPFCVQAMNVAEDVETVGETELLLFIKDKVNHGTGVLIDARTPDWFKKTTIPGLINIPFNTFTRESSNLIKVSALEKLGVTTKKETKDEKSLIDQMMSMIKDDAVAEQSVGFYKS